MCVLFLFFTLFTTLLHSFFIHLRDNFTSFESSHPIEICLNTTQSYLAALRRCKVAAHNLHPRMLQFAIKTFCDIQPAGSGPFSVCDDEAEGSVIEPSASVSLGLALTLPNIQYSISTFEPNIANHKHSIQPITYYEADELDYSTSESSS